MTRSRWRLRALMGMVLFGVAVVSCLAPTPGAPVLAMPPLGAPPTLRLSDQTPFVSDGDMLTLTLDLDRSPPDAQVVFRLHADVAAAGRDRFLETTDGERLGSPTRTVRVPLDRLPTDAAGDLVAAFPILADQVSPLGGFQLSRPGVYPLSVTLEAADGADLDTFVTHVVNLPVDDGDDYVPLDVVIPVSLTHGPALSPSGQRSLPESFTERAADVLDALTAYPETAPTLLVTPETLGELARQVSDRGLTLDALAPTVNVPRRPYVDVEVSAWLEAGMGGELLRQFAIGAETQRAELARTPDPRTWIVDEATSPSSLDWFAATGTEVLVVPSDRLVPLEDPGPFSFLSPFEVVTPDGVRLAALATDPALEAHVTDAGDPALAAQHTLADLAMLWFEQPGTRRVAALRISPDHDATYLHHLLAGLDPSAFAPDSPDRPGSVPVLRGRAAPEAVADAELAIGGTDQLRDSDAALARTLTPALPASPLGAYPTQLDLAHRSLDGFRSMLGPTQLLQALPLEQHVWTSGARQLDARERQDHLDTAVAQVNDTAAQLDIPNQPRVTLTEQRAEIPIVIENGATVPLSARLALTSDKLDFPDGGDVRIVELQPGSNRIVVEVESRASGAFPVTMTLSSPDETIAISSSRFTVRSTAVSGIGLVLSIGAGVFLLLWWARHFHSTRRAARLVAATPVAEAGAPTAEDSGGAAEPAAT